MTSTEKNNNGSSSIQSTCLTGTVQCDARKGCGVFMGGVFILVGGAFLLQHLGRLPEGVSSVVDLWPALIIWAGISHLLQMRGGGSLVWGVIVLSVGGALLARSLGYVEWSISIIWPSVLVLLGVLIFFGALSGQRFRHRIQQQTVSSDRVVADLFMSGREDRVTSQAFSGGTVSCVMAGLVLDLRDAEIAGDEAVMEVRLIMGGLELHVPPHWEVISRCNPVLGGIENKSRPRVPVERVDGHAPALKRLVVDGSVVMGGVEIRN